jgi:hypothetical protein
MFFYSYSMCSVLACYIKKKKPCTSVIYSHEGKSRKKKLFSAKSVPRVCHARRITRLVNFLNSVHLPIQKKRKKPRKIAAHRLFEYKVTDVCLQTTTCFSAWSILQIMLSKNFTFWLCGSDCCPSCNSTVDHWNSHQPTYYSIAL